MNFITKNVGIITNQSMADIFGASTYQAMGIAKKITWHVPPNCFVMMTSQPQNTSCFSATGEQVRWCEVPAGGTTQQVTIDLSGCDGCGGSMNQVPLDAGLHVKFTTSAAAAFTLYF